MELAPTRLAYLQAADAAVALLGEPAVEQAWGQPSALDGMTVGGLAAHLARQVLRVPPVIDAPAPDGEVVTVLAHYASSAWVDADLDDEINVQIRQDAEQDSAGGAAGVLAATVAAVERLRTALPAEPADRAVNLPWTSWALSLDDFLVTRLVEITVHCDDLAVSVGVAPPALPAGVLDPVLDVLTRLSVRRHGPTAVLRALSRAERAPTTITAF